MGDERAERGSASDSDRDGSEETAREVSVLRLKRENERLRDRLDRRRRERHRIVDRYETLLDAARTDADGDTREGDEGGPVDGADGAGGGGERSAVERLLARLRRS